MTEHIFLRLSDLADIFEDITDPTVITTSVDQPLHLLHLGAGASNRVLLMEGDSASPAVNDEIYASFFMSDAAGSQIETGRISSRETAITAGAATSQMLFGTRSAGTFANRLLLQATGLLPLADNTTALGATGGFTWADLFLGAGAVINFNSNVLLTHTTDLLTMTGGRMLVSFNVVPMQLLNTVDTAAAEVLRLQGQRAAPAANDTINMNWYLNDSTSAAHLYAQLATVASSVTNGAETGAMTLALSQSGALGGKYIFRGTEFTPQTNDLIALGSGTLSFADLFLASGGLINWANGNVTATHASGALTFSSLVNGFTIRSTDGGATGPQLYLDHGSATPAASDVVGLLNFQGRDSGGNATLYARIHGFAENVTDTTEAGQLRFGLMRAGAFADLMVLTTAFLSPLANDGLSLGTPTLEWSDLYVSNGATINWNNGNVIATHSATRIDFTAATSNMVIGINSSANNTVSSLQLASKTAGGTTVDGRLLTDNGGLVEFGSFSNHPFTIRTNSVERFRVGTDATFQYTMGGTAVARTGATSNYNVISLNNNIALGTSLGIFGGASGDADTVYLSAPLAARIYLGAGANQHRFTTVGFTARVDLAIPAGGTTGAGVMMGSTANFGMFFGSGAPTLSAAQGSLYLRSDGSSTSTRLYVNTNGSTGWTNVTTAT